MGRGYGEAEVGGDREQGSGPEAALGHGPEAAGGMEKMGLRWPATLGAGGRSDKEEEKEEKKKIKR